MVHLNLTSKLAAIVQLVECQISDEKITGYRFDSPTSNVSLEKTLYAYFSLGLSSLLVVVAQSDHRPFISRLETDSWAFFSSRFIFLEYANLSNQQDFFFFSVH